MIIFSINKFLFFPSLAISILGSSFFTFATGIYLLEITGKSTSFSLNLVFSVLPLAFLSPFLGGMADKISKKKLIILSDLFNCILMISIFFLWGYIDHSLLIYTGTFLTQIFGLMVFIAFESGKPELFQRNWLTSANSYSTLINSLCKVLGPSIGGLIYSFTDMRMFILINGCSFFISMILEFFLEFKKEIFSEENINTNTNLKSSITFLLLNKDMKFIILIGIFFNLAYGVSLVISIPYLINNKFYLGGTAYGIIQGCLPIGMILGSLLVKKYNVGLDLNIFKTIGITVSFSIFLYSLPLLFFFDKLYIIILYSFLMFLFGLIIPFFDIPIFTYLQQELPINIRGQILGLFISCIKIIFPMALLISGAIIDNFSIKYNMLFGFFLFILFSLFVFKNGNRKFKVV